MIPSAMEIRVISKGFSLLEVLVSMFILSIGLLGLMSLQLMSLQTSNNSSFRTQATIAAYDMSERIRANMDGIDSYKSISSTASGSACSGTCSVDQRVANDIKEWKDYLSSIPEGKGMVAESATATDGLDITVTWVENNKNGTQETKEFILRARFL